MNWFYRRLSMHLHVALFSYRQLLPSDKVRPKFFSLAVVQLMRDRWSGVNLLPLTLRR